MAVPHAENGAGDVVSMAAVCSDQDLISTVFRYLDIKDLCSATCVCRFWNLVRHALPPQHYGRLQELH
jgi:hypothetical protein